MDKKNEYQDEGLRGNEKIEEAIFLLQKEPSQEQLAHTLTDRKSTRLNSSHANESRMPSSA